MFFVDKLMSVIFLFLVYFDNVETVMSLLAMIISSKSTVDLSQHYLVTAFWLLIHLRDLLTGHT